MLFLILNQKISIMDFFIIIYLPNISLNDYYLYVQYCYYCTLNLIKILQKVRCYLKIEMVSDNMLVLLCCDLGCLVMLCKEVLFMGICTKKSSP